MFSKSSLDRISMILNNIRLVKENREVIVSARDPWTISRITLTGLKSCDWKEYRETIDIHSGLCRNLNLFSLENVPELSNDKHNALKSLALLYLNSTHKDKPFTNYMIVYPLGLDKDYKDNYFLNPERWVYLEFIEKQLNYALQHGKFSDTIEANHDQIN